VTRLPRCWLPESEAEIQHAIDDGSLSETHYLDCKREVGLKGDRKETARDLASFAIYGGGVLIGVEEDKANRVFTLAPQPLAGLAERIENLAWSTIDSPLDVTPHEIESKRGGGLGYLLVEVRPSPFAPHMVDGAYYGRGEKTRIRLTDPQVRRYHAERQSVDGLISKFLDEEIARDPVPADVRRRSHLYLVAHPLTAPANVARTMLRRADDVRLREIVQKAEARLKGFRDTNITPRATEASQVQRRAQGIALCSGAASGPGRTMRNHDPETQDRYVDIEFREDGGIRALVGRATVVEVKGVDGNDVVAIFDWLIVAYAVRLVGWAAALGHSLGYRGTWGLGLHVSELRGLHGLLSGSQTMHAPRFDSEAYRAVTTASLADLEDKPEQVAGELVGRLLFALEEPQNLFAEFVSI
jgi:hypothetical protein